MIWWCYTEVFRTWIHGSVSIFSNLFCRAQQTKPQNDFSSFLLCCNPGDLPKHHLELGQESRTQENNQKSAFHHEGVASLERAPVTEIQARHTRDCKQHFRVEGRSSCTAATGMARNRECLAGKSKQARRSSPPPQPSTPWPVPPYPPSSKSTTQQPKTLSLRHTHCAGHWGQSYQTPLNISRHFCFLYFLFMRIVHCRHTFLLPVSLAPGTQVCMYQYWLEQRLWMPGVTADPTDPHQNEALWTKKEGTEFSLTICLGKRSYLRCSTQSNISIFIIWLEYRKLLRASLKKKKKSASWMLIFLLLKTLKNCQEKSSFRTTKPFKD